MSITKRRMVYLSTPLTEFFQKRTDMHIRRCIDVLTTADKPIEDIGIQFFCRMFEQPLFRVFPNVIFDKITGGCTEISVVLAVRKRFKCGPVEQVTVGDIIRGHKDRAVDMQAPGHRIHRGKATHTVSQQK